MTFTFPGIERDRREPAGALRDCRESRLQIPYSRTGCPPRQRSGRFLSGPTESGVCVPDGVGLRSVAPLLFLSLSDSRSRVRAARAIPTEVEMMFTRRLAAIVDAAVHQARRSRIGGGRPGP
jgi:hypothetical protein